MIDSKPDKKNKFRRSQEARDRQRQIRTGRLTERISLVGAAILFLIHTLGLALLFNPIAGIINTQPVIEQDWGLHFHHLKSMEAFFRQDRIFWGYNPLFMAGYPSNTIQDLSIKLFELLAFGLSAVALTPIQWFKILAFIATAGIPAFGYLAARNFFHGQEVRPIAAPLAALMGTVYWWNSLPREMFFYGMIGYPIASYVGVLGVSLFYRLTKQPAFGSSTHLGWLLFAVAVLPLHVQAISIFLPAAALWLVVEPRLLCRNLIAWVLGAAALALLANLAWLAPAFSHRGDDVSSILVDQLALFTSTDPLTFVKDYLGPKGYWTFRPSFWEKGFRLALLALGLWGTLKLMRSEARSLGILFAGALMVLFIVTYFGSFIGFLKSWQPLRFKVPYDLFLILPASYLMALRFARHSPESSLNPIHALALVGCVAFVINLIQTESRGKMNLRTGVIPEVAAIVDWIQRETSPRARVLFEESGDETGFVYDGMYLSSFLPHWTNRQLIGGPINLYNDRHHFAEFHSGKLFKRDIQTLADEEIKNFFRLYNIGAVVAFHPLSLQRLQSVPGLIVLDRRIGPVHLMKVSQSLTWFLQGEGQVTASLNRVQLSEVRAGEKEILLKYHWVEGLVGTPAVKIVPVQINDDPIPFIKLVDPPNAFTLQIRR